MMSPSGMKGHIKRLEADIESYRDLFHRKEEEIFDLQQQFQLVVSANVDLSQKLAEAEAKISFYEENTHEDNENTIISLNSRDTYGSDQETRKNRHTSIISINTSDSNSDNSSDHSNQAEIDLEGSSSDEKPDPDIPGDPDELLIYNIQHCPYLRVESFQKLTSYILKEALAQMKHIDAFSYTFPRGNTSIKTAQEIKVTLTRIFETCFDKKFSPKGSFQPNEDMIPKKAIAMPLESKRTRKSCIVEPPTKRKK